MNLIQLQRGQALRLEVAERLATGRRINRVQDDPQDFITANVLANRIGDLAERRTRIQQAQGSAETAQLGLRAVEDLTRQLRGIATAARGGTAEQRQAAAGQFDAVRDQIGSLAADSSYGGVSLIDDPADDQTVQVGDLSDARVRLEGQPASAAALGIGTAAGDYNGFAADADIDGAIADLARATDSLRAGQSAFASDQAVLTTRDRFSGDLSNTLEAGRARLNDADLNGEAARRLALQIQDELGQGALRFAARTERLVVDLLASGEG